MSKNLIYTTAINSDTSQFNNSEYSQYCINSWTAWCKKMDIDFLVIDKMTGPTVNNDYKYPVWAKDLIFDYVGDKYDKIIYVDSDTMVKWDAPNPFDLYTDEFCVVNDRASIGWILRSLDAYKPFFPKAATDDFILDNYFNSGVCFFTKEHKYIFDELQGLYLHYGKDLDLIKGVGKVQTVLNYVLKLNKVKIKYLPPTWNLFSIHKKDMFKHNWQLNEDPTPFFIKYAFIWHFTGFPIEDRTRIMRDVWLRYKDNYGAKAK